MSRRASAARSRDGASAITSDTPSSNEATTSAQRSVGTRRTTAHRSATIPASNSASPDKEPSGSRMLIHSPSALTAAPNCSARVVEPWPGSPSTTATMPRCRRGTRARRGPLTSMLRSFEETREPDPLAISTTCESLNASRLGGRWDSEIGVIDRSVETPPP